MSVDRTERVIRAYLDALGSGGDFARFFAPNASWTTMETGEVVRGREQIRDLITYLHRVAFDARMEIRTVVAGDDVAVLEASLVGRHAGAFAGVEPTGREVSIPYTVVYELRGEEITALRGYASFASAAQQLAAPGPQAEPVASA